MKITIVGAGRVGVHLAKYFADEQQDVFLIDRQESHLSLLESDFNLRTFVGEPTDLFTLKEAGADIADVFVAVTANTAENLVSCAMAKSMGARKTIARVDRFSYIDSFSKDVMKQMGVDHVVFPDSLAADSVVEALVHPWTKGWTEFENGSIVQIAVRVEQDSPIAGMYLKDLSEESHIMHISAVRRKHLTLIPRGDHCILPNDTLYITALPHAIEKVKKMLGVKPFEIRNVILMGGSAVSELTVKLSNRRFSYVIIEKNQSRCRELIKSVPESEIICGDASEQDVLEEAGIKECDAFVALTDITEGNILSCLTAKDLGVKNVIAEIEKEQLISKAETFFIDSIINKPVITANAIFQIILDSNVDSSKCFTLPDAEVGRMQINANSFLTKDKVMNLRLPHELTFAAMIREGRGEMVTGATQFREGDIVIVFCTNGALKKVEKLFRK